MENPDCRVVIFVYHSVWNVVGREMGGYDFDGAGVSALSVEFHHWTNCPGDGRIIMLGIDDSIVSLWAGVTVGRYG